ncbi:hypothetical protein [Plantibacter sp. YIM 135347]|uniref:hypothetical protein n=1 Tax=Plantibacter sp. YIM 135347 TaxID=3423919 RepID=UPI003D34CA8E
METAKNQMDASWELGFWLAAGFPTDSDRHQVVVLTSGRSYLGQVPAGAEAPQLLWSLAVAWVA